MIADLQMPVMLVAFLVALPYLLSPLQIFLGNWSDRHPAADYHRTPWILLGGLLAATGSYFTVHVAYLLDQNFVLGLWAAGCRLLLVGRRYQCRVGQLSLAGHRPGRRRRAQSSRQHHVDSDDLVNNYY